MCPIRLFTSCALLILLASVVVAQQKSDSEKKAAEKDLRHSLLGAWVLVGEPGTEAEPQPGARIKFWGLKHWAITQSDPETNELIYHHGGTYTLDGDNYEETIEFAAENTSQLIGQKFTFKIKVDNDTYVQTGINNQFNEQWKRLKAE